MRLFCISIKRERMSTLKLAKAYYQPRVIQEAGSVKQLKISQLYIDYKKDLRY